MNQNYYFVNSKGKIESKLLFWQFWKENWTNHLSILKRKILVYIVPRQTLQICIRPPAAHGRRTQTHARLACAAERCLPVSPKAAAAIAINGEISTLYIGLLWHNWISWSLQLQLKVSNDTFSNIILCVLLFSIYYYVYCPYLGTYYLCRGACKSHPRQQPQLQLMVKSVHYI